MSDVNAKIALALQTEWPSDAPGAALLAPELASALRYTLGTLGVVVVDRYDLGRVIHEAKQVGGPWSPCPWPYGYNTGDYECECPSMGAHLVELLRTRDLLVQDAEGLAEQMTDYSRARHSHPDDVSCAEAGEAGHPPWKGALQWPG